MVQWTQNDRGYARKWEDDCPSRTVDSPSSGYNRHGKDHDNCESDKGDEDGEPEALENLWHFLEEVGELDFLLCSGPGHVVREQVSKNGTGQMQTKSTEEKATGNKLDQTPRK